MFLLGNIIVYLVYVLVELLRCFIHQAELYAYKTHRANTLLTSVLLVVSVLEVTVCGLVASQVISALLLRRNRKVRLP